MSDTAQLARWTSDVLAGDVSWVEHPTRFPQLHVAPSDAQPDAAAVWDSCCARSLPGLRGAAKLRRAERTPGLASKVWASAESVRDGDCPAHIRGALSRFVAQNADEYALDRIITELVPGRGPLVSTGTSERPVRTRNGSGATYPAPRVADYVARCPASQYKSNRPPLVLRTWVRGASESQRRGLVLCGSWRCDSCERWRASVDFARIAEAFEPFVADDCVYLVLTLDRDGRYSGDAWADATQAFGELSRLSRNFLSALNRWFERMGWEHLNSRWVGTVEAHRSGWPHLNMVLVHPQLAAHLREDGKRVFDSALGLGRSELQAKRDALLMRGQMRDVATGTGWGPQSSAEPARSRHALAGYLVKLARKMDETVAEVAKMTQRPTAAPLGLRRLRSGQGFLPPRRRSGLTGVVLHSRKTERGVHVRTYGRPSRLDRTTIERWATRAPEVDEAIRQEAAHLERSDDDETTTHAVVTLPRGAPRRGAVAGTAKRPAATGPPTRAVDDRRTTPHVQDGRSRAQLPRAGPDQPAPGPADAARP